MTIEKTVIAKFEGEDDAVLEIELRPDGEVTIRETWGGMSKFITGLTLEQLALAVALFEKERAA